MKKRIISLLMCALMAVSMFAACGKDNGGSSASGDGKNVTLKWAIWDESTTQYWGDLKKAYEASVDAVYAARQGIVDDVIDPAETRKYLITALEIMSSKHEVALPKKHSNMPL